MKDSVSEKRVNPLFSFASPIIGDLNGSQHPKQVVRREGVFPFFLLINTLMVLELKPIEGPGVDCSMLSTEELNVRRSLIDTLCREYTAINKIEWISADDFETVCKMDNSMLQGAIEGLRHVRAVIELNAIMELMKRLQNGE